MTVHHFCWFVWCSICVAEVGVRDDESIKDCEGLFKSIKVLTQSGKHFGAGPDYVHISMLDRARNFRRTPDQKFKNFKNLSTQVLTWSGEHFGAGFASLRGFLQEHQGADSEREAF
ncbi:Allinase [Carex littledalei]|uniref:Allinase n=1 Tax=Carex littledalei TaxID=544730 RepID=A0A833QZD7_9POAL|nr:Allinase [Carex littledalei]